MAFILKALTWCLAHSKCSINALAAPVMHPAAFLLDYSGQLFV